MSDGLKFATAIIAIVIVGPVGCTAYNAFTAPARVANRTLETDNIINNYEWFKRQHNDILAVDKRIETANNDVDAFKNSAGPRSDWDYEDKTEFARLNAILTGLKGNRADMVSIYNAKSQMANRNIFKSNDLPETVE